MTPLASLAASLYEAFKDHPACRKLGNEQIEAIAHAAAEHLQMGGYRVVKQTQVGWVHVFARFLLSGMEPTPPAEMFKPVWADEVRP